MHGYTTTNYEKFWSIGMEPLQYANIINPAIPDLFMVKQLLGQ